jgi:hypothetical protein
MEAEQHDRQSLRFDGHNSQPLHIDGDNNQPLRFNEHSGVPKPSLRGAIPPTVRS